MLNFNSLLAGALGAGNSMGLPADSLPRGLGFDTEDPSDVESQLRKVLQTMTGGERSIYDAAMQASQNLRGAATIRPGQREYEEAQYRKAVNQGIPSGFDMGVVNAPNAARQAADAVLSGAYRSQNPTDSVWMSGGRKYPTLAQMPVQQSAAQQQAAMPLSEKFARMSEISTGFGPKWLGARQSSANPNVTVTSSQNPDGSIAVTGTWDKEELAAKKRAAYEAARRMETARQMRRIGPGALANELLANTPENMRPSQATLSEIVSDYARSGKRNDARLTSALGGPMMRARYDAIKNGGSGGGGVGYSFEQLVAMGVSPAEAANIVAQQERIAIDRQEANDRKTDRADGRANQKLLSEMKVYEMQAEALRDELAGLVPGSPEHTDAKKRLAELRNKMMGVGRQIAGMEEPTATGSTPATPPAATNDPSAQRFVIHKQLQQQLGVDATPIIGTYEQPATDPTAIRRAWNAYRIANNISVGSPLAKMVEQYIAALPNVSPMDKKRPADRRTWREFGTENMGVMPGMMFPNT